MKKLLLYLTLSLLGVLSCSAKDKRNPLQNDSKNFIGKDYVSYYLGDRFAVFYNSAAQNFHAVQYEQRPAIALSKNIAIIEFAKKSLKIRDLITGVAYTFNFAPQNSSEFSVISVITFKGETYKSKFLVADSAGNWILDPNTLSDPNGDMTEATCGCKKDSDTQAKCDSGGEGATECSVNDAGSVGISWEHGCQVACKQGYFACCKKDR